MYRITEKTKGWIVEVQKFKYNFLGLHFYKVWKPFVKTSGMNSCWHHSDRKYAEMNLHKEIKDTQIL